MTITTRSGKGSTLTHEEMDGNITDLDGRVTTNAANIATNTADIATNTASIVSGASSIATNAAGIAALDVYVDNILTASELQQLQAIESETISSDQWGYLGAMDQTVASTAAVDFATVSADTITADTLIINGESYTETDYDTDGTYTAKAYVKKAVSKIVAISSSLAKVFYYDARNDSAPWIKRTQWTSYYNEELNTATRGATREFPEEVIFAVEILSGQAKSRITIYDATDPDLPMWMVADTGAGRALFENSTEITGLHAKDGLVVVSIGGTLAAGGLCYMNFVLDEMYLSITGTDTYNRTTIADRNISRVTTLTGVAPAGIVNRLVNGAKIAVLSTAATNPATKLPFPTTLVVTEGGASVVNYNGSAANEGAVVDLTGATSLIASDIDSNGFCLVASPDDVYVFEGLPSTDTALTSADHIIDVATSGTLPISGTITSLAIKSSDSSGNAEFLIGTTNGLYEVSYISGGTDSVVRHISDVATTPGMSEDTITVQLCETTAGTITVSDKVPNGDFTSNGDDWLETGSSGVVTFNNDQAIIGDGDTVTNTSFTSSAFTTVVGQYYICDVVIDEASTGSGVRPQLDGSTQPLGNVYPTETFSFGFIGDGSNTITLFRFKDDVGTTIIDSVSVKEGLEDRSGNLNFMRLYGTLTKTVVGTDSSIVSFSNFSASNYGEISNSFAVGTGDFQIKGAITRSSGDGTVVYRGLSTTAAKALTVYQASGVFGFNISGSVDLSSGRSLTLGVWSHFVCGRRDGVYEIYLDGDLVASSSTGGTTDLTYADSFIRVGYDDGTRTAWGSEIANIEFRTSIDSAAQIKADFLRDVQMFRAGSVGTISDDSVTAIAYDPQTEKTDVAHTAGTDVMSNGLRLDTIDSATVGTSDTHLDVSRINDNIVIATDAEVVCVKPIETL